jgi:hypothetical protein
MKMSNCPDLGYDITVFDMAAGIEPTSILCFGITACEANGTRAAGESRRDATAKQGTKCGEKHFPHRDAENGNRRLSMYCK